MAEQLQVRQDVHAAGPRRHQRLEEKNVWLAKKANSMRCPQNPSDRSTRKLVATRLAALALSTANRAVIVEVVSAMGRKAYRDTAACSGLFFTASERMQGEVRF